MRTRPFRFFTLAVILICFLHRFVHSLIVLLSHRSLFSFARCLLSPLTFLLPCTSLCSLVHYFIQWCLPFCLFKVCCFPLIHPNNYSNNTSHFIGYNPSIHLSSLLPSHIQLHHQNPLFLRVLCEKQISARKKT